MLEPKFCKALGFISYESYLSSNPIRTTKKQFADLSCLVFAEFTQYSGSDPVPDVQEGSDAARYVAAPETD